MINFACEFLNFYGYSISQNFNVRHFYWDPQDEAMKVTTCTLYFYSDRSPLLYDMLIHHRIGRTIIDLVTIDFKLNYTWKLSIDLIGLSLLIMDNLDRFASL